MNDNKDLETNEAEWTVEDLEDRDAPSFWKELLIALIIS